ncbi:AbrB/MazE/SpoVT family DNA-binding domain-containing protein [Frankia sp. Cj3]|uniref:AbrB/MazE/SpoVT family DNA-binding domain-containing protein n=1 Tax=Frankia sp. Cj3 TaxID=2880976 RepID=UPI001EF4786C|nr:AbrB/MazE/SpoVT family DNA-binding domain-containing protein [Frankia sp. Cj3]
MNAVRMRASGELPLPAEVVAALHADEGDLVRFDIVGDGIVRLVWVPSDGAGFWTEGWQAGERRAEADVAAGRGRLYHSAEDMFADLDG